VDIHHHEVEEGRRAIATDEDGSGFHISMHHTHCLKPSVIQIATNYRYNCICRYRSIY
jgi:hypothetical protein